MSPRDEYQKSLAIVASVVRQWDPYGLIESGAPDDQFDTEIALVTSHIPQIHSAEDAAQALSNVFTAAFNKPEDFSPKACAKPGADLFDSLQKADLIPPA